MLRARAAAAEGIQLDEQGAHLRDGGEQVVGQDLHVRPEREQQPGQHQPLHHAEGMVGHHHQRSLRGRVFQRAVDQLEAHAEFVQRARQEFRSGSGSGVGGRRRGVGPRVHGVQGGQAEDFPERRAECGEQGGLDGGSGAGRKLEGALVPGCGLRHTPPLAAGVGAASAPGRAARFVRAALDGTIGGMRSPLVTRM